MMGGGYQRERRKEIGVKEKQSERRNMLVVPAVAAKIHVEAPNQRSVGALG